MDGELLRWLYHRLLHDPTLARTPGCTYGDGVVLLAHFYAASNNGSLLWASDPAHWPAWCRAAVRLPSYSQLNKRLKTASVMGAVASIDAESCATGSRARTRRSPTADRSSAAPPPTVPPPARGKVPDRWARGYQLHVIADAAAGAIDAHELTPLDAGEATVLRRDLVPLVDLRGCTPRDDANYASNPCYGAVADAGGRMVASRRKPGSGLGHHPQH